MLSQLSHRLRLRLPIRRYAHKETLDALRKSKPVLPDGPSFQDFLRQPSSTTESAQAEHAEAPILHNMPRVAPDRNKVFIETYGCQMNSADSEIVLSVMQLAGYEKTDVADSANVILLNTCAIRENAEDKVWRRLESLKKTRERNGAVVGVLGCMAERLKTQLLEHRQLVDIVCGPDAYRDLPRLVAVSSHGDENAINVMLSADETYADIAPVRLDPGKKYAFVSIMRGCNNLCSYCVVPFTRGRERSRPIDSIVHEVKMLSDQGIKEVTLLGQNVNSYAWRPDGDEAMPAEAEREVTEDTEGQLLAKGFSSIVKVKSGGVRFGELLDKVALIDPEMRIRFTSPHPKDFPDPVLDAIAAHPNVCKSIHIPAQSGSSAVLQAMRRGYTREAYLDLIQHIRNRIPNIALSSDFISGFCGETESDHADTISLLEQVRYDYAYMFAYSMREKTHAHRKLVDDIPEKIKLERLSQVIDTFHRVSKQKQRERVGSLELVLVENEARRNSDTDVTGRGDCNLRVHFAKSNVACASNANDLRSLLTGSAASSSLPTVDLQPGDYVAVRIVDSTSSSLRGVPIARTTLQDYHRVVQHLPPK
jgi:MiaB/RimO family radical SAM methylthiotransferase